MLKSSILLNLFLASYKDDKISRSDFEESIEGLSFCVLEDDLITAMSKNCLLTEKLNKFYNYFYKK